MKSYVSIGLLGLGTVGSGVVQLIQNHQEELQHQVGCEVRVKSILVRNTDKERDIQIGQTFLTSNPDDILQDPDIDLVVEVIGGIEEAREHMIKAIQSGKHVVTANKDLIALHGPELLEAAAQNQVDLFYEASVGGGIPILRGLSEGLVSDRLKK